MSSIVVSGDTSGAITISAPAVAGTNTLTLPAVTDTLTGIAATQTLTNKTLTSPTLTTPALGTPASGVMTNVTGINYDGYKNRIINGAMVIDQRNAGASTNNAGGTTTYALDRWSYYGTSSSKFSIQQSTTAPAGFSNSILITSLAATTIGTNDEYWLNQKVEGFNSADLSWGTADAKTVTLSFWVRSSLTGTFGGSFINSAFNYYYAFSYTISSANTWTQVSITVVGPTAGTWIGSTNGVGLSVVFGLSAGSTYGGATPNVWTSASYKVLPTSAVNILATNAATWYVTGVQLEKGSTATSFDYRPYGTELQLCQRYYENNYSTGYAVGSAASYPYNIGAFVNGYTSSSGQKFQPWWLMVQKRTAQPTNTYYDTAGNSGKISSLDSGGTPTTNVSPGVTWISDKYIGAGPSTGTMTGFQYFWTCSAEL